MIPKTIHYCWFGKKPMGKKEQRCLDSWKYFCPNYDFIRWDESNSSFDDTAYVQQAFQAQKWAFVSDYIRIKALWEFGGIYLDTDVQLVKPLDPFLVSSAFMGFEAPQRIATCVIGTEAGHPFFQEVLQHYSNLSFLTDNGTLDLTTNVARMTSWLTQRGLCCSGEMQSVSGIQIYPQTFFSPKDLATGRIELTENTHAIHHFNASWMPLKNRINTRLAQLLGPESTKQIKQLIRRR